MVGLVETASSARCSYLTIGHAHAQGAGCGAGFGAGWGVFVLGIGTPLWRTGNLLGFEQRRMDAAYRKAMRERQSVNDSFAPLIEEATAVNVRARGAANEAERTSSGEREPRPDALLNAIMRRIREARARRDAPPDNDDEMRRWKDGAVEGRAPL